MKVTRPEYDRDDMAVVLEDLAAHLNARLKHGPGVYASPHETLGVVAEEYDELLEAVRSNDAADTAKELMDVAVGALFGIVSLMKTTNRSFLL